MPETLRTVAVLFARKDSIYKTLPGCDVWDIERDARNYVGGGHIVAHPPCRAWGAYRFLAKPRPDEKALATWAVDMLRRWGGILEHPAASLLWPEKGLPEPGDVDKWGGFTVAAPQFWWGHLADKPTRFYIVGCKPGDLPPIPFVLGEAPRTQSTMTKAKLKLPGSRPELLKKDREKTPPALAEWLIEVARRCKIPAC